MIDPQANPRAYLKLMALVAALGLVSALVTFAFVALVGVGTGAIWEQAAGALGMDTRLFTVLICTLGGLLVGLLVKLFGDHNAIFAELMQEFGKTGRFDYHHAPGILVTSLISLMAGAALGPEAALADTCGGIGTQVADKLKLDEKETRTMGFGGMSAMADQYQITDPSRSKDEYCRFCNKICLTQNRIYLIKVLRRYLPRFHYVRNHDTNRKGAGFPAPPQTPLTWRQKQ